MKEQNRFEQGNGKRLTQYDRVLNHLKTKGSITDATARRLYGISRLGAVIFNLRRDGYNIETQYVAGKNRYGDKTTYGKYVLLKIKVVEL